MPLLTILPDPDQLELVCLRAERQAIIAIVRTRTLGARCPQCGRCSQRVQSRYVRRPADLPWHGVAMRLELHVRRLFCDTPDCPQAIFAERLPGVLAPYARRTDRLAAWFTAVGLALGGEAGARLLARLCAQLDRRRPAAGGDRYAKVSRSRTRLGTTKWSRHHGCSSGFRGGCLSISVPFTVRNLSRYA
jgi:transposase